jgi:hypothetical protein
MGREMRAVLGLTSGHLTCPNLPISMHALYLWRVKDSKENPRFKVKPTVSRQRHGEPLKLNAPA